MDKIVVGLDGSHTVVPMTQAEIAAQQAGNIPIVISLKIQAQAALDKSDITMLRCVEAGVTVPASWNTYRKALRAIATGVDTTSTTLPIQPAYVAGT